MPGVLLESGVTGMNKTQSERVLHQSRRKEKQKSSLGGGIKNAVIGAPLILT